MIRIAMLAVTATLLAPAVASAGECEGRVAGLSRHYDPSTGSGFLAVRAGPTRSATQIGELFNGDRVTILDRRGRWYQIYAEEIGDGWASVAWLRSDCRW